MELLSVLESAMININLASGSLGLIAYLLGAWSLYTIAKRREIKKPWLAWIPFGNEWILGSLADQYQYVVNVEVKNKRKVLLGLSIAMSAIASVFVVLIIWMMIEYLLMAGGFMANWMSFISEEELVIASPRELMSMGADTVTLLVVIAAFLAIPLLVLGITYTVYFYKALYDVFRSCEPNNSVLYLVVSIVGGFQVAGIYAIFLLICREKDLGMPPRKTEPAQEPVVLAEPSVESWTKEEE